MEDGGRGAIVLLRRSGARLAITEHVHGALSGVENYLRRLGVRERPDAVEAKEVQK